MANDYIGEIAPHGGKLVNRVLTGQARERALERALHAKKRTLNPVNLSDLELIAVGAFSPIQGFMSRTDYQAVVDTMHLANALPWSIPITLAVSRELSEIYDIGQDIALVEPDGHIVGLLELADKYEYDKVHEAKNVYRTDEDRHPGVARLYAQGDIYLAGDVWLLDMPRHREFIEFRHTPEETRKLFAARGWRRIVAFQTRNPIHRAHEYIQKTALEIVDGLLLHPLVGETKADDIPADVRMESYQSLLRDYYPPDRVLLGVFPAAMRYAGPREAIFHALCRKNYGCTHMIIGRDHAGVGKYYGTYDAQKIFDNFTPSEIGITPLFFEHTFYCRKCGQIVSAKTCPHPAEDHIVLSGTQVREMLERGEMLPPEFTRPEVARVLMEGVQRKKAEREALERAEEVEDEGEEGNGGSGEEAARPATQPPSAAPIPPLPSAQASSAPTFKFARGTKKRVLVLGLDCGEPSLVFQKYKDELPNLRYLATRGAWGPLESVNPPITVPAWACSMTSKDPGTLGIYGFRNRADYSYERMTIANSRDVKEPAVWDYLGRAGKQSYLIGVPPSYPPKPIQGGSVGCFLSPSTSSKYTYPESLKEEIAQVAPNYMVDVDNFRTENKQWLLGKIYEMTEARFKVIHHLMKTRDWDFMMSVEIGVDRLHHGFWKYHDPLHRKHEPGNPFVNSIHDYYVWLDKQIGATLELIDDNTTVIVMSDHGAKRMEGGICINEWLVNEGYLTLDEKPRDVVPLLKAKVNWDKSLAWGEGGYYSRIFMNVQGREPNGVVPPSQYEKVRDELVEKISAIPDPNGKPIGTKVYKPQSIYRAANAIPPDLIVVFGNLYWRSVGSLGLNSIQTFENDTGPDDANHAQYGLYIYFDPKRNLGGCELHDARLVDVAPTVLNEFGHAIPDDMIGKIINPM
jgi:ATP sulfurylase